MFQMFCRGHAQVSIAVLNGLRDGGGWFRVAGVVVGGGAIDSGPLTYLMELEPTIWLIVMLVVV
jgi:hypothetical protein